MSLLEEDMLLDLTYDELKQAFRWWKGFPRTSVIKQTFQALWQWRRGVHSGFEVPWNLARGRRGLHRFRAGRHHCRGEQAVTSGFHFFSWFKWVICFTWFNRFTCLTCFSWFTWQTCLPDLKHVQIDADGSGTIDFEEFVKIMNWSQHFILVLHCYIHTFIS